MRQCFFKITAFSLVYWLGLALAFALNDCAQARSLISGVSIHADKMTHKSDKNMIELLENVQIIFQGQYLSSDKATINLNTQEIIAEGHVTLQSQTFYSGGTKLQFNYNTNLGTIYNGFLKVGSVFFKGRVIKKTGQNEYLAENSYYSACETCPAAWSFTGSKIKAEVGKYAYIKYPVLRIADIPIFALPWIFLPLKNNRQSGFLSPEISFHGDGKMGFALIYFWAISRSQDVTLTLAKYEKWELKPNLEYRYVLTENSRGSLTGSFFEDNFFEQKKQKRWFLKYHHRYEMPEQIIHRTDLNMVSDTKYARDFPNDLNTYGESALENRLSITKNYENTHLSGEVGFYTNQLTEDSLEKDQSSVHRFPEIHLNLTDQQISKTPFYFGFNSHYIHFARRHFAYDDVVKAGSPIGDGLTCPTNSHFCISRERDGAFEPSKGDLLRTGHRFGFQPRLTFPFQVSKYIEVLPLISYQEMQYRFTAHTDEVNTLYSPTASQRFLELNVGAKTRFSSIFGDLKSKSGNRYKHIIEPEFQYSTLPWIDRPEHYFFGQFKGQPYSQANEPLQDNDFFGTNKVQFDYKDRVFDQHLINFAITNRILRKTWTGHQSPRYSSLGLLRLSQSFDFNEAKAQNSPQPWSTINALVSLNLGTFEIHSHAVYYPYAQVTNSSSRFKLKNQRGDFAEMTYTNSVLVNKDNKVSHNSKTKDIGLLLGWEKKYLHLTSGLNYSQITNKILSWYYNALIKFPGNCWGIHLTQFQVHTGKPEFKFVMNFQFGGKESTPMGF